MADESTLKSNVFTDEGRLVQTEFAIKNIAKAGTIMGMQCTDGVVLIGLNSGNTVQNEKIYKLNDNTFCAIAGLFGDANRLIKYARKVSCEQKRRYNETLKTSVVCKFVAWKKQYYTQNVGTRPFGVSILYAGSDETGYKLYATDPSGTINLWRAVSIGQDSDGINSNLNNFISDELVSMDEAITLLLKVYSKVKEPTIELADKLEILKFSNEKKEYLTKDMVVQILQDNELVTV
ncbi:PSA3 [Hepatospora eriocheir]|uniref:PSA3 n=1 Tax=Hepatospora eriocheir TaxID=1081669 RepID=A0A1X0QJX9_9MICR|nr:PSA3 [Hepatospora eriocheir]